MKMMIIHRGKPNFKTEIDPCPGKVEGRNATSAADTPRAKGSAWKMGVHSSTKHAKHVKICSQEPLPHSTTGET
jgi:hypothetical protein